MVPRINELLQRLGHPAICLEYGTTEVNPANSCARAPQSLQINDCGMSFSSFWRFEPGIEVAVSWEQEGQTSTATGLVISCEAQTPHRFHTTLYFLEREKPARRSVQRV